MKPGLLYLTVISLFLSIMFSCSGRKTDKQIFDANVNACMKPLVEQGVEVAKAKSICECALNTMLKIDSSYLKMEPAKQKQFYSEHEMQIVDNCDELKKLMVDPK